jgi:hypothetical protein
MEFRVPLQAPPPPAALHPGRRLLWPFKRITLSPRAPLNAHVSHNEDYTLLRSTDSCGLGEGVERANLGQATGGDWSGSWTSSLLMSTAEPPILIDLS